MQPMSRLLKTLGQEAPAVIDSEFSHSPESLHDMLNYKPAAWEVGGEALIKKQAEDANALRNTSYINRTNKIISQDAEAYPPSQGVTLDESNPAHWKARELNEPITKDTNMEDLYKLHTNREANTLEDAKRTSQDEFLNNIHQKNIDNDSGNTVTEPIKEMPLISKILGKTANVADDIGTSNRKVSGLAAIAPKNNNYNDMYAAMKGLQVGTTSRYSDELAGLVQQGMDKLYGMSDTNRKLQEQGFKGDIGATSSGDVYTQGRDEERANLEAARKASPKYFTGGSLL